MGDKMVKKILITGKDSYIGSSFSEWMGQYRDLYKIDTISTLNNSWKDISFHNYDVIYHVAGIAHVNAKKDLEELYYKVNRDLTIDIARKAKAEGVKQFIFMSSIIVYGDSSKTGESKLITNETIPVPTNFYGDSKLQAEAAILQLQTDDFKVAVLRPPMIYGKNSKGNYPKLAKLATCLPVFPDIDNQRSMLHVDNLCEFVRLLINDNANGIYFPQNKEYVSTSKLVKEIAKNHGKVVFITKMFNPLIQVMARRVSLLDKIFGNLVYDKEMSSYRDNIYCVKDFEESVRSTEL